MVSPDYNPSAWKAVYEANVFHTPAVWETRSAKATTVEHKGRTYRLGQQCTYSKEGILITEGTAAGTPDLGFVDPGDMGDMLLHALFDVVPYVMAEQLDLFHGGTKYRDMYLQVRPPDQGPPASPQK
jgi:hypothetical protein